jgi:hypothetical protein
MTAKLERDGRRCGKLGQEVFGRLEIGLLDIRQIEFRIMNTECRRKRK